MIKILLIIVAVGGIGFFVLSRQPESKEAAQPADTETVGTAPKIGKAPRSLPDMTPPLEWTEARVTKKPFGLFVDAATSPIQPERFSGYHTGVDFEVFPDEEESDVAVRAICKGQVVEKRVAAGYGGVLVTSCTIADEPVTVLYGHLRFASIGESVGDKIEPGDEIGMLGTGGTSETDGERKHLHLAIHRGSTVNVLGYVSKQEDLSSWLDPCLFVCR